MFCAKKRKNDERRRRGGARAHQPAILLLRRRTTRSKIHGDDEYSSLLLLAIRYDTSLDGILSVFLSRDPLASMAAAKNVAAVESTAEKAVERAASDKAAATPSAVDAANPKAPTSRGKSLKDRSKIPYSFYITVTGFLAMAFFGNVLRIETLQSWASSMLLSTDKVYESLLYSHELGQTLIRGEYRPMTEYLTAAFINLSVMALLYIFVWAPLRAGFWTGARSRRHVMHRYMGLAFMAQYFLAWFEYSTNYEDSGKTSFLPMFIALNGKQHTRLAF
jgi:hypothetical protein